MTSPRSWQALTRRPTRCVSKPARSQGRQEPTRCSSALGIASFALKVTLQHEAPWRWQVLIILAVEAGQLEGIAAAVLAFCRALGAAA